MLSKTANFLSSGYNYVGESKPACDCLYIVCIVAVKLVLIMSNTGKTQDSSSDFLVSVEILRYTVLPR